MTPVTADVLRAVAPRFSGAAAKAQAHIIDAIAEDFSVTLDGYEINTPLRVAHFLAQIIHESAGLRTTEEFASGAAYEGRVDLGNTVPGDGKRYKGRGTLQLTGRANYRRYGTLLGLDLEGQPHIAAEPLISLKIACVYWQDRKINPLCDADDLVGVTRKVNGGLNGLEDRRRYLAKAKAALSEPVAVASADEVLPTAPLAIPAADPPKETKAGLLSDMSFAKVNDLADQGSRIAGWLRSIKRWFWGGGAATVGGTSALMNTNSGAKHGLMAIIADHPFLFVGLVLGVVAIVAYCAVKLVERHLVTAYRDGRYTPRKV